MAYSKFFSILSSILLLTGCAQFGEQRNWRSLSDTQRKQVTDAHRGCTKLEIVKGELVLKAKPVVAGAAKGIFESQAEKKASLRDEAVIGSVWEQRVCVLSTLDPQLNNVATWLNEVNRAKDNWPAFDSAAYAQLVATYRSKRDEHIARIYKDYDNSKLIDPVPVSVLDAAFPYLDFLNISTVSFGFQTGDTVTLKGQKIGGSSANICLKSGEYSTAIRPALDQTRTVAFAIGTRRMTIAQALDQMVTSVYEAGTTRMLEAKDASDRKRVAVSCGNQQASEEKDKPMGTEKPDVKKTDETKPANKKAAEKTAYHALPVRRSWGMFAAEPSHPRPC